MIDNKLISSVIIFLIAFSSFTSCSRGEIKNNDTEGDENKIEWKSYLQENIGLLGHRNWIVVTDMAYPLQSKQGIITIDTAEDYNTVLTFVNDLIKAQPHVKSIIYQDLELTSLTNKDVPKIEELKKETARLFGDEINYIQHEELILRLDEVSKVYNIIILKSNLTMPYTTTFFELDCKYWGN